MERVGSLRILGVTIASDLSVSAHVDALLNAGARSIYALRLLRAHGLPDHALKIVARATTINRIQYAGPAWWGYANAADKGRIQRLLERMFKSGFLTEQDTDIESQMMAVCRGGGSGHRVQRPVVYKDPDESNLRSHTLPLWGRQTIGGDRPSRPSARRGQRDHETRWAKRVFISSLHTSRSKVREEGHPSCQARTGEDSCVHTALLHTALLHTNALSQ